MKIATGFALHPASTSCRPSCGVLILVHTEYDDAGRGPTSRWAASAAPGRTFYCSASLRAGSRCAHSCSGQAHVRCPTIQGGLVPVLELEEFPVPRPVRPVGAGGKLGRVHLTDQAEPSETGDVVLLCGNVGPVEPVELTLEEIDELPVHDKCRRCGSAMTGHARVKRLT